MLIDMVEVSRYLIVGLICGAIGFGTNLGYQKWRHRRIVLPFITASSRNFTGLVLIMSLLSVFAIAQSSAFNTIQANCNAETRRVLQENSDISSRQAVIDKQARDALTGLVADLIERLTAPPVPGVVEPPDADATVETLQNFRAETDRLERDRETLQGARSAYPLPRCE